MPNAVLCAGPGLGAAGEAAAGGAEVPEAECRDHPLPWRPEEEGDGERAPEGESTHHPEEGGEQLGETD